MAAKFIENGILVPKTLRMKILKLRSFKKTKLEELFTK